MTSHQNAPNGSGSRRLVCAHALPATWERAALQHRHLYASTRISLLDAPLELRLSGLDAVRRDNGMLRACSGVRTVTVCAQCVSSPFYRRGPRACARAATLLTPALSEHDGRLSEYQCRPRRISTQTRRLADRTALVERLHLMIFQPPCRIFLPAMERCSWGADRSI